MMYSLDEIGLIPAATSSIKHRVDINPFYGNKLPIFVAPMTCLINDKNWGAFKDSAVTPIYPVRFTSSVDIIHEGWSAVTVETFRNTFLVYPISKEIAAGTYRILIDCANGNMEELFELVRAAKKEYGDKLVVMVGNIANPLTYLECCKAGVDYVRVGIGGGSGCTTSVQTGIHASMPWILEGIKQLKEKVTVVKGDSNIKVNLPFKYFLEQYAGSTITKIIADGGITNPSRAIKCLALGADYVMMGKAFAECKEVNIETVEQYDGPYEKTIINHYYGQSSTQGQMDRFGKVKANPEGTDLWVPVTTTLQELTTKFEAALRSAMSYCGAETLKDFIGKVKYEYMSPDEFRAYNK